MNDGLVWLLAIVMVLVMTFTGSTLKIIKQWEGAVVFRLGVCKGTLKPGLRMVVPFIDKLVRWDVRMLINDVPGQSVVTKDNISLSIDAVVFYRVRDPMDAVNKVTDARSMIAMAAQGALRDVIGSLELDTVLQEREMVANRIRVNLDDATDPWGIDVRHIELTDLQLPHDLTRAMAKEAEADREARARIIKASAEREAAAKLAEAQELFTRFPALMELRRLQVLTEVGAEHNATRIMMLPDTLLEMGPANLGKMLGGGK
ncbi:MAG: SPFH domain-containing protein [Candidatus Thalassarchaeaceae archaeon]|jgi:regulator of protease activity HflC (stomatin/prohibitin superfamily)|nr:SPFH domain-containing protein [Candidatus Thalassarchaeaceae archaeon]